ncbi:cation:proton antiporter domain-containing protein [Photobacterium leiognathi]|uniref:cation:proton antiporter domain-containing protein n=1 Tax=Photobacterium leiognathi TaxID=553611 RepID=UPI002980BF13|nr:cation:proton antiporter [Photobacterium leiognathi]
MVDSLNTIISELCAIVISTAAIGSLFLYAKQPIIIAYIVAGIVIGPYGIALINNANDITQMGHIGVILLLFLLGLNLQPQRLLKLFRESALITLACSLFFFICTFLFALLIRLPLTDALIAAAAMMFSSTVIGLKLIPTTTLHHQRIGEIMTSILLIQDILAISVLLLLNIDSEHNIGFAILFVFAKLIIIIVSAYLAVKFLLLPLMIKFDVIQEYSFIATLAWCFFWAEISHRVGLSYETGAFIAGTLLAVSPISNVIALHLKPLREFFLILFFFAVGANINLLASDYYTLWGIIFGIALVRIKAWGFNQALAISEPKAPINKELSARLSQASEFSLLLAYTAIMNGMISEQGKTFIQMVTLTTFILSTYWIVTRYPTPISNKNDLRQD